MAGTVNSGQKLTGKKRKKTPSRVPLPAIMLGARVVGRRWCVTKRSVWKRLKACKPTRLPIWRKGGTTALSGSFVIVLVIVIAFLLHPTFHEQSRLPKNEDAPEPFECFVTE
jgi:hypothetical protein